MKPELFKLCQTCRHAAAGVWSKALKNEEQEITCTQAQIHGMESSLVAYTPEFISKSELIALVNWVEPKSNMDWHRMVVNQNFKAPKTCPYYLEHLVADQT